MRSCGRAFLCRTCSSSKMGARVEWHQAGHRIAQLPLLRVRVIVTGRQATLRMLMASLDAANGALGVPGCAQARLSDRLLHGESIS